MLEFRNRKEEHVGGLMEKVGMFLRDLVSVLPNSTFTVDVGSNGSINVIIRVMLDSPLINIHYDGEGITSINAYSNNELINVEFAYTTGIRIGSTENDDVLNTLENKYGIALECLDASINNTELTLNCNVKKPRY